MGAGRCDGGRAPARDARAAVLCCRLRPLGGGIHGGRGAHGPGCRRSHPRSLTAYGAVARDLRPLFDPRSVAIVGASDDPAKWGNWLGRGALKGEHRRPVYLVNRNGGTVLGRTAYTSLAELPDAPELVVVAVPAAAFEQAVDDALAVGARALIGITAGLGELGAEAGLRERALVERVRAASAVLLGPNCLGV